MKTKPMKTKPVIELQEWNAIVTKTYGRPYDLQQQDGCMSRGTVHITVPDDAEDFPNDSIEEKVNGPERGVSFAAWLARDPKKQLPGRDKKGTYCTDLFWSRNFYPDLQMVANDLHAKGLLEKGRHTILIDW